METEIYPAWSPPGVRYLFTLRAAISHELVAHQLRPTLTAAGFPADSIISAEQTHSKGVGVVRSTVIRFYPDVDALITRLRRVPLVIRVADCGPIFIHDPVQKAIGLVHSGRKGTELNILAETVESMRSEFGSAPEDLSVFLGPCIRPPYYDIDFAGEIARQARAVGVVHYIDSDICTGANLDRYYSYRMEKGQTGRMWAVIMLEE